MATLEAGGSDMKGEHDRSIENVGSPSPAPRSDTPAHWRLPTARRLAVVATEASEWLRTLASAALYATLIVTFLGQIARVEGASMLPTLHDQDRLIVNKLEYRWHRPQIGDIVMLASPEEPDKMLVKRIVAGPGDVVESIDGRVYRNALPVSDDFIADTYRSDDTWDAQTVPKGHYFVMGDHRNNSLDSRTFGPVPERYILGKIHMRWWPVPDARLFR